MTLDRSKMGPGTWAKTAELNAVSAGMGRETAQTGSFIGLGPKEKEQLPDWKHR